MTNWVLVLPNISYPEKRTNLWPGLKRMA
jgi:hypothetical protein